MTLNDQDLLFLADLLAKSEVRDTIFAERVERAMNERLEAMNTRMMLIADQMDHMARAKQKVNEVTWYGGIQDTIAYTHKP